MIWQERTWTKERRSELGRRANAAMRRNAVSVEPTPDGYGPPGERINVVLEADTQRLAQELAEYTDEQFDSEWVGAVLEALTDELYDGEAAPVRLIAATLAYVRERYRVMIDVPGYRTKRKPRGRHAKKAGTMGTMT